MIAFLLHLLSWLPLIGAIVAVAVLFALFRPALVICNAIPGSLWVLAVIVLVGMLGTGLLQVAAVRSERDAARAHAIQIQGQFDAYKVQAQAQAIAARDAAIKAQQAADAETQRRISDQQEASHVHEKQLNQARADAADAADAVARLRKRIAQLSAAGSGGGGAASADPAAASVGSPAARVGDVAGQCVGALAQLRDIARLGQLAGDECSARYDALRSPAAAPP